MRPWINLEYFFNQIIELLKKLFGWLVDILNAAQVPELRRFALVISLVIVAGIIYTTIRIRQLNKKTLADVLDLIPDEITPEVRKSRWDAVLKHMESDNQSEWKMGIMEADNLLDEILKKIGVSGENLGARLKNIEVSDFQNLQNAWEAHKTRNKIAHEGVKFQITKEQANRTINLYERALKEFKFI